MKKKSGKTFPNLYKKERTKARKWLARRKTWPTILEMVTPYLLGTVIERTAHVHLVTTPEGKLILAIIAQAISDADSLLPCRDEARRFFTGNRLDAVAPLIGLNPQFVRETIGKVRTWI